MRNFSMILVLALFCLSCSNNSSEINANKQINTDTVQNKNVNVAVNTEKSAKKK
jgi:serine protease inhibitor